MTEIKFIKMHGCGNDFVIIDGRFNAINLSASQIQKISNRKFGVGCDQLIVIYESNNADCKIKIYNADGNEVEACGNGTRCVAHYIISEKKVTQVRIETLAGILSAQFCSDNIISVDMGKAKTAWHEIPMIVDMDTLAVDLVIDNLSYPTAVNIGNPHVVFFVDDFEDLEIDEIGYSIENHYYFPKKTNVNFAKIIDQQIIELKTYERGVGKTLACGTGACATVFAAVMKKLTKSHVLVKQEGGDLDITIHDNGHIEMKGKIEISFTGVIVL